ncbi:MAG: hypothetical protein M3044_19700 [Thermoproteota archaeon]|nr:hypothetical protein [Thermoproteota archaeon]
MPLAVEGQLNPFGFEQPAIENKWKCNVCHKIFDSQYILNYHKLLEHSEFKRPPIGIA